jgi:hypothetical protein
MQRRDAFIALAILTVGIGLSVVVFTALRDDAPSAPTGFPTGPQNVQSLVETQVRSEIERLRPMWVERCWAPSAARDPEPKRISFIYDSTFDPRGMQVTRSFRESRDASRPARACRDRGDPAVGIRSPGNDHLERDPPIRPDRTGM